MNKMFRYFFISLMSVIMVYTANAQRFGGFTGSTDAYIDELEQLYSSDANMKKEQSKQWEQMLKIYDSVWSASNSIVQKEIVRLSQQMFEKNIRARNGFAVFVQCQIAFADTKQSLEGQNQWLKGCQRYLSYKTTTVKRFGTMLEATLDLLTNNALYLSKTIKWEISKKDYVFRFDSIRGVYVVFDEPLDLTYSSSKQSNVIHQTTGMFFLTDNTWEGKGGKVDWTRVGLPADNVFVELKNYDIDLKRSGFTADSVNFINKEFFSHTLFGRFEDVCGDKAGNATYPRFYSYKHEEIIKNVFENVDYVGGFTQQGGKFLGTGRDVEPAQLIFTKEGKKFAVAKALVHPFSQNGIISQDCQITFYINNDSVYHPGTKMSYNKATKELFCSDNKEGISASPWISSYHCVDIYCEGVNVNLNDYKMEFAPAKSLSHNSSATIESNNFFSEAKWMEVQKVDDVSPLYRVKQFTDKVNDRTFTVAEFAQFLRLDQTQTEVMLINLALDGFIIYENYHKTAIAKQKLYDFIAAKEKKLDHDAIRIVSNTTNEPNAMLNMLDMTLWVHGVKNFSLSDTHNIVVSPYNGDIIITKNRNIDFNGRITAGRFILQGNGCKFSYDNFALSLPAIDSLKFYVPLFEDSTKFVAIQTPMQKLKCELLIDAPDNKGSIRHLVDYPILSSLEDSYVYYDNPRIQSGVYHRENFYYKLDPFKIKNLFSFKTDSIKFTGVFVSAGIFPDIYEPLRVMRDYSLGFLTKSPQVGLAAYGGKGQYYESLDLSLNGLLGTGHLDYIASRSYSKMFVFHPDSMMCETEKFACTKNDLFPNVEVTKTTEQWYPKQDYMLVRQKAEEFYMFGGEALHKGSLTVTPAGLFGNGTTTSGQIMVNSVYTKFKDITYTADTSKLIIKSIDKGSDAFVANNVRANVSFQSHKGEFVSNEGLAEQDFPYLQYKCEVDRFDWDMDKKLLSVLNSESVSLGDMASKPLSDILELEQPGATFVSTHPKQKELTFNAVKATLDLAASKLTATGVYLIRVADAAVKPINGTITIYPGAQMDTIEKAEILANTETQYLHIYDARIHIASASLYSANGYVDYIDEDGKKYPLFMKTINPSDGITKAEGEITRDKPLALSSAFLFYGSVSLTAADSSYLFDGGVQLTHQCSEKNGWLRFKSNFNPDAIYIPIPEAPTDIDGNRLTASVLYDKSNLSPKIAFISSDKEADNVMIKAQGYLTYDKTSNEYRIASKEKLEDFDNIISEYMTLNKRTCRVRAKGDMGLGFNDGIVTMDDYGTVNVRNNTDGTIDAEIETSLAFKFPFSQSALDLMGVELYEDMNLEPIELETSNYQEQLIHIFGEKKGQELYDDLLITGEWKQIPKGMDYTLYFTNVKLKWDNVYRCYLSQGNAELAIVGKYQMNKKIRTRIQLMKGTLGTELRIYIEANPDSWYYISYNGSALGVLSSLEDFNAIIDSTPRSDKEFTAGNKRYVYRKATEMEKRNFIRKLELGIDADKETKQ
ncbi:MAG: hypothetical protein LBL74_01775 [Bacteroidales bacterium]|jgi:hypothetical protein|nr:hypothetical protein [Bacteroidales bacterium]